MPPVVVPVHEYGGCSSSSHLVRGDLAVTAATGHVTAFLPDEGQRRVLLFDVQTRAVCGHVASKSAGLMHVRHFRPGPKEWLALVTEEELHLHQLVPIA